MVKKVVNLNQQHMVNLNWHRVITLTEFYTISSKVNQL